MHPLLPFIVLLASAPASLAGDPHTTGHAPPLATAPFGPTGHRVVGRIAMAHLSPQAAAAVADLLGHETLAQVATWPDDIRSAPEGRMSSSWHYVTIEDGDTFETSKKSATGDAVRTLRRFVKVLEDSDADKAKKVEALKWIVHLVGDLHQPLHVGRGEDRGGNTIDVKWFGEDKNLHTVWDTGLIESTKLSFSELASFIDHASPTDIQQWQRASILDWVNESISYRDRVYEAPGPDISDSYKYAYKNLPLVKLRLLQAGVRLAGLLNKIYGASDQWQGMPNALHWVRNTAEYRALTRQVYRNARQHLATLSNHDALPVAGTWAVALDADETILDNSLYQKETRNNYSEQTWLAWCRREQATAVPGVIEFLQLVRRVGGKIAIVSNRHISVQAATEANLKKLGVPFDVVLLKDDNSQKEPRWDLITAGKIEDLPPLQILMFFGDNIEDFPDLDQSIRDDDDDAFEAFGKRYFVLPNPVYGSWRSNARK